MPALDSLIHERGLFCTFTDSFIAPLIAGPYKVNGVPLRRVNQSYVIATSTKVNIEGLELPAIDDAYFAKEKAAKKSKEEQFFAQSSAVSFLSTFVLLVSLVSIPLRLVGSLSPLHTIPPHLAMRRCCDGRMRLTNPLGSLLLLPLLHLFLRGGSGGERRRL